MGGATYQKCVHIILENQIGRNIKGYIDDIVVKSKKCGDLLDDLKETFDNLHKYKMILNPKKIHVWRIIREATRLHGIIQGDICKSHQGGSHRKIATTEDAKRNPEASMYDGSP
jgi:hypothetical protein